LPDFLRYLNQIQYQAGKTVLMFVNVKPLKSVFLTAGINKIGQKR